MLDHRLQAFVTFTYKLEYAHDFDQLSSNDDDYAMWIFGHVRVTKTKVTSKKKIMQKT